MSKSVEKAERFIPIQSDYKRFVAEMEAQRPKRLAEKGAKLPQDQIPKRSPREATEDEKEKIRKGRLKLESKQDEPMVKRLRTRMQESLGAREASPPPVVKKETKARYMPVYEKAGGIGRSTGKLRVGPRRESTDEEIVRRKRALQLSRKR